MITGRPFTMKRIRANRDKLWPRPEEPAAGEAAAAACSADVSRCGVGLSASDHVLAARCKTSRDYTHQTSARQATAPRAANVALAARDEGRYFPYGSLLKGGTFQLSPHRRIPSSPKHG